MELAGRSVARTHVLGNAVHAAGFIGISSNLRDHQTQRKRLFVSQKAAEVLKPAQFLIPVAPASGG